VGRGSAITDPQYSNVAIASVARQSNFTTIAPVNSNIVSCIGNVGSQSVAQRHKIALQGIVRPREHGSKTGTGSELSPPLRNQTTVVPYLAAAAGRTIRA